MDELRTQITTFEPGATPTRAENLAMMRAQFEKLMERGAVAMVLTVEFANGDACTAAVGPPLGLETLSKLGVVQVLDMLKRGRQGGENG